MWIYSSVFALKQELPTFSLQNILGFSKIPTFLIQCHKIIKIIVVGTFIVLIKFDFENVSYLVKNVFTYKETKREQRNRL